MNRRRVYANFAMTALLMVSFFVWYAERAANAARSGKDAWPAGVMLFISAFFLVMLACAFLAMRKELLQLSPKVDAPDAPDEKVAPPSGRRLAIDLALPVSTLGVMLSLLLDTSDFVSSYRPLAIGVAVAGGVVTAIYIYEIVRDYRIARRETPAA